MIKTLKITLTLVKNFIIDFIISFIAGLVGSAFYFTFTDATREGTILHQFLITLIALQLFRFVQYVKGKL